MFQYKHKLRHLREDFTDITAGNKLIRVLLMALGVYVVVAIALGVYWSFTPKNFNVIEASLHLHEEHGRELTVGSVTTATTITLVDTLLHKPGGFLRNDVSLPGVYLDNIPSWEYGVLIQVRDMAKALREVFARSQSQSSEDADLSIAEPRFNFSANSWILPRTEGMYAEGNAYLLQYMLRLSDPAAPSAQFYARADNLNYWLAMASTRLGSLSQRLSASVGQRRLNTDLAGDSAAMQSTPNADELFVKTSWHEIDDVFYEARGASWALLKLLEAVEVDFAAVIAKKNAAASLQQIIRELERTQEPLRSPIILNGSGFGMLANHSLVMAGYISRANTGIIDLRDLLSQG